jgi:excisionase family DNA binding protein
MTKALEFISIREAASRLKVSYQALSQAIKRGTLRCKRMHNMIYTTEEWLKEFKEDKAKNTEKVKIGGKKVFSSSRCTVKKAAVILGIPPHHLYFMLRQGKVKSERIGRYYVIPIEEVEKAKDAMKQNECKTA